MLYWLCVLVSEGVRMQKGMETMEASDAYTTKRSRQHENQEDWGGVHGQQKSPLPGEPLRAVHAQNKEGSVYAWARYGPVGIGPQRQTPHGTHTLHCTATLIGRPDGSLASSASENCCQRRGPLERHGNSLGLIISCLCISP